MLRKLKLKFIIVIMSIVTVIFAAAFGLVMHLTQQNYERESVQMMRGIAFRPPQPAQFRAPDDRPDDDNNNIRLPFFTVRIMRGGEIEAFGDYYDLSDKEKLKKLVDEVRSQKKDVGILKDYDLRYMKNEEGGRNTYVFADISSEKAMLRGLVRNSVVIGLIGFAIFLVISIILAEWVTKPVQKTWNEQKQFIADASHELKTPITVIMTNAEMLEESGSNGTDRAVFAKNILSTSKRMRGLVESLLELARLDNNRKKTEMERLDYSRLVNDCLLPFEPMFYENDIDLLVNISDNIFVNGNKDKLRQVITILLDNALKYDDPQYPVSVELKVQSGQCILSVYGRGEPLSKEDCKNIFKRFYRVDKARSDGQSYGLGLSIAESIINEHKGRIWAESRDDTNYFYVSLCALTVKE